MNLNVSLRKFFVSITLFVFLLYPCFQDDKIRTVERLKIAVLPDQNELKIRSKYQPLVNHLSLRTGLSVQLLIPDSYTKLLHWFDSKQIDLALFGGVTFVKAQQNSNAIPLVMRDVDENFSSVVLIQSKKPAMNLEQLKGLSFAFGSRLSTSGHFMPRYFFQQQNITPETFFSSTQFSGAHDLTAEWVRDGIVDVGVVNSTIANQMFLDGRLTKDLVKVVWQSPSFADYVWAIQADINIEQRNLIRDSFLHLSRTDGDGLLLNQLGAHYYIPASINDFDRLSDIVIQFKEPKTK